ncbi:sensor histidine kinase [Hymenobacter psychrotolerans]|uniref:histidine kinase n=1 Tax=Hymenobacter psychrotolerans DSM 18569 TaxID=1121959 RepID=A0A1M6WPU8_9BACT|nr:PAS domain-containing sensor histidine kinase [Hymenobacter psychrotolerans]SHK95793.1 Signal transduction histidine kinase [Hymenobacter psychrotolerans DSM 18569]
MLSAAAAALAPDSVLLRELLEVSLTGIILYSPQYSPDGSGEILDFTFEYLNPAAQRMMRMPEIPTLSHMGQWPHSKEHGTFQFHVEAYESGEPREYNINYQADGYDNYYRLAARRAGDGLWVSFTDTADQPRSPVEIALREAQARERDLRAVAERERALLQTVVTQAPAGICLFQGPEHVITLANGRICTMWDRPAAEVLNRPLLEVVPELMGQGFTELLDEVARTGQPHHGTEVPAQLRQNGRLETHYFNFVYQPVYDAAGALLGIFDLVVDVTDQVAARLHLQQLNQELEARVQERTRELQAANAGLTRTNVDLDNFIYTASHDLKAPISNIEGLLYLLQEELPATVARDEAVEPILTRMLEAVERFKRTIEHLTEVSKLQKEHAPAATAVNLAAVVEDVRQDLLPQLQAAGTRLEVDVAVPAVQFSEKNLRSIIYNLLSNAIKYRHPERPSRIALRAQVRDDHTVLEVHDNGLGVDPAHLPRLFTMFQRFYNHVEGTGIGLYMVKRMVENAGGRVEVLSQFGTDTTFTVFLPHESRHAAPVPASLT